MNRMKTEEITRNALIGQAVGDAFGVPVEFLSRERVRMLDLRDMAGSDSDIRTGTRWGEKIPKGCWSDDTSMTVASMASFAQNGGRIDYEDQMARFMKWWFEGEYCSHSFPFGLGGNVSAALERHRYGIPALDCGGKDWRDNGNGALMRILPFSLYCIFNGLSTEETMITAGNGSALTHGHAISRMCCFIWTEFLRSVSAGAGVDEAVGHIEGLPYREWFSEETVRAAAFVTEGRIHSLTEENIGETGYVVDTLYAALYSLLPADGFEACIRRAVNLGYDTDTAGAVAGTAAGILYGSESVPKRWLNDLKRREYLESAARSFAACFSGDE